MILDTALVAVLITILTTLMIVAFGYGALNGKVKVHDRSIEKLESANKIIDSKLDLIIIKMAVIEALAAQIEEKV